MRITKFLMVVSRCIRSSERRMAVAAALFLCSGWLAGAQELEPRRWSHMPLDVNFASAAYIYTKADIFFDPVLELEDVKLEQDTYALAYLRTFKLLDHSARVDFGVPYKDARWDGILRGEATNTSRRGLADAVVRFSMNLVGGPPLKGAEFAQYRAAHPVDTIVGAGVSVQLPTGEYYEEKLLNLGENRYTIRPQLGVVHSHHKWSEEVTGSASFFTDNNEFFNGNHREQEPLYSLEGHLVYSFRPGLWAGGGVGYGYGGESSINGVDKDDRKGNLVWIVSTGYPFSKSVGMKIAYVGARTQEDTGSDSDNLVAAVSVLW